MISACCSFNILVIRWALTWIHRTVRIPCLTWVDPNRKVPDLYFKVVDPKLPVLKWGSRDPAGSPYLTPARTPLGSSRRFPRPLVGWVRDTPPIPHTTWRHRLGSSPQMFSSGAAPAQTLMLVVMMMAMILIIWYVTATDDWLSRRDSISSCLLQSHCQATYRWRYGKNNVNISLHVLISAV